MYRIRIILFSIMLMCTMTFNVSAEQSKETFKHLNYVIDAEFASKSIKNKKTYYLTNKQNIPKLDVYLFKKNLDFTTFNDTVNPNKLRVVFKDLYAQKSVIKDINYEVDERGCLKVTYNVETKKSECLKANSYLISSEKGLYVINLQVYSEDEIDYKWDEFVQNVDVQGLRDYFQQAQQLKQLKSEIKSMICLASANNEEKSQFEDQKENVLILIGQKASIEDVQAAKSNLEQINVDIQSRIDQEEAAQTTIDNVYYCEDGTNVGNSDPHAKGRANACYGYGGFVVNH